MLLILITMYYLLFVYYRYVIICSKSMTEKACLNFPFSSDVAIYQLKNYKFDSQEANHFTFRDESYEIKKFYANGTKTILVRSSL